MTPDDIRTIGALGAMYNHPAVLKHGTEVSNVLAEPDDWTHFGDQPEVALCAACGTIISEVRDGWAHMPQLYYTRYDTMADPADLLPPPSPVVPDPAPTTTS